MKDVMEEVRLVINKLYKSDREIGTWHDYRVDIKLQPNPLDYDGCDACTIEVHEFKKELVLTPKPHEETIFDKIIFESKHNFSVEEALEKLSEHYQ